jgi:hypothetical protein
LELLDGDETSNSFQEISELPERDEASSGCTDFLIVRIRSSDARCGNSSEAGAHVRIRDGFCVRVDPKKRESIIVIVVGSFEISKEEKMTYRVMCFGVLVDPRKRESNMPLSLQFFETSKEEEHRTLRKVFWCTGRPEGTRKQHHVQLGVISFSFSSPKKNSMAADLVVFEAEETREKPFKDCAPV